MTTSLQQLMNVDNQGKLNKACLVYLKEFFRSEVNDQLLEALVKSGLTKADMARRLEKRPESITRWLSSACNLEIDTIVELAAVLGVVPRISFEGLSYKTERSSAYFFKLKGSESYALVIQGNYETVHSNQTTSSSHNLRISDDNSDSKFGLNDLSIKEQNSKNLST